MSNDPDVKPGWTTPQSYLSRLDESYRLKRANSTTRIRVALFGMIAVGTGVLLILIERF